MFQAQLELAAGAGRVSQLVRLLTAPHHSSPPPQNIMRISQLWSCPPTWYSYPVPPSLPSPPLAKPPPRRSGALAPIVIREELSLLSCPVPVPRDNVLRCFYLLGKPPEPGAKFLIVDRSVELYDLCSPAN